jgi:hypothetical protein
MAYVAAEGQFQGGGGHISPIQIAHHPLFTAREKLELLYQLRAEAAESDRDLGFDPDEIDLAIEDVKRNVESGEGSEPALIGDN